MTHPNALYKPSILELAQAGNCQAITYWINSFLGPQGIYVRVQPTSSTFLKVFVNFQRPNRREACLNLRDRLVRFICYRLWVLNSEVIGGVRIIARIAGDPTVLWQQSIRINSLAGANRGTRRRTARSQSQFRFQVMRSLFLSSITLIGFFFGYWFFYLRVLKASGPRNGLPHPATLTPAQYASTFNRVEKAAEVAYATTVPQPELNVTIPRAFEGQMVSQIDVPDSEKVVALTFDDGPWLDSTDQILGILRQYNIKATFFMVGMYLQRYPDVARRVVAAGHAVGNHSWSHPLHDVSAADAVHELDDTAKLLYDTTGVKTSLFRPPGGLANGGLTEYAREKNYALTMWAVDSEDYYVASPILMDNVLKNVRPGQIVLMHDGGGDRSATVQALPQIINTLRQQGYRFVTVPELLNMQRQPQPSRKSTIPATVEALATDDHRN